MSCLLFPPSLFTHRTLSLLALPEPSNQQCSRAPRSCAGTYSLNWTQCALKSRRGRRKQRRSARTTRATHAKGWRMQTEDEDDERKREERRENFEAESSGAWKVQANRVSTIRRVCYFHSLHPIQLASYHRPPKLFSTCPIASVLSTIRSRSIHIHIPCVHSLSPTLALSYAHTNLSMITMCLSPCLTYESFSDTLDVFVL